MERFIVSETNSLDVGSVSSLVDTSDKKDRINQTTYTMKALRKGKKLPGWLIQYSVGLSDNDPHNDPGHRRRSSSLRNT